MAFKQEDLDETPIPAIVAEIWARAMPSTNYKEWDSIYLMIQDIIFQIRKYSRGSVEVSYLEVLEKVAHQHTMDLAPKTRAIA